jgi:DUF1680 family protein
MSTLASCPVILLPSRWRDQVLQARDYYAAIDEDALLHGFRRQAGLPAPGAPMAGWCQTTSSVIFGQIVSGLALLGTALSDPALHAKSRRLVAAYAATLPPDGNARMRLYDWDKLVCGLVDAHQHAGAPEAPELLARTIAWAAATFDRTRAVADGHDFWGAGPGDTPEWYTLSENLYRAAAITADPAHLAFAAVWHYDAFWAPFAGTTRPRHVRNNHAYSHVNSLASLAARHAETAQATDLAALVNAHDWLVETQCYATGGYGPEERLMPKPGSLGRSLSVSISHAEIICGSWAALKLCRYLLRTTGAARFADWLETILINAIGAALPPTGAGEVYYYGNYAIAGGTKQRYWQQWPCCAGTYPQIMGALHDVIAFHRPGALHLALYLPAEIAWTHDGQTVRAVVETAYPESDTVDVALHPEHPTTFTLALRKPAWATAWSITVDGIQVPADEQDGWLHVTRLWSAGDRLRLHLPMQLRAVPVDPQHPARAAIMFGPTVLAQDEACCRRPFALAPDTALETRLVREGNRFRLTNTVPERHTRYLVPFHTLPANWPYWVYFDLHAPPLH